MFVCQVRKTCKLNHTQKMQLCCDKRPEHGKYIQSSVRHKWRWVKCTENEIDYIDGLIMYKYVFLYRYNHCACNFKNIHIKVVVFFVLVMYYMEKEVCNEKRYSNLSP